MPQIEITVQYVNLPVPPKKFGSIKTSEGDYFGGMPALLRQFSQGEVCKIEYEETDQGYKNLKRKIVSTKAPPLSPPPRQRTNPVDNEHIFITALLKEFVASGKVNLATTDIVTAVKTIRDAYRVTLGGLEKSRSDEMDDEIPFDGARQ